MVIHCPLCKKVIAKGFDEVIEAEVEFTFAIRCPHCTKDVTVRVTFEAEPTPLEVVRVIKQAKIVVAQKNIHIGEEQGGGPRVRIM